MSGYLSRANALALDIFGFPEDTDAVPEPSPLFRLADNLLEGQLRSFITERRAAGTSWRIISRDLYEATGRRVDVTYETLRTWFLEDREPAA